MSGTSGVFADLKEVRQLGAPVVALVRTALGRDPNPTELARWAPLVRERVPLAAIAAEIVGGQEFAQRYAGLSAAERAAALRRNALGDDTAGLAEWGSEAETVAMLAEAALMRGTVSLLPGLVPGAPPDDDVAYRLWVAEYDRQDGPFPPDPGGALVSLLAMAGDTEAEAIGRTVASLQAQSHPEWELCLAARTLSPWSGRTVAALAAAETRVRLAEPFELRAALAASRGPLVGVVAPGDQLAPDALARVVAAFGTETDGIGLVFTDEDVADAGGRHSPRFKPGFSPDRPEVGGLAVLRRNGLDLPDGALTEAGLVRHTAQRLRPAQVRHLPAVLLHRAAAPAPIPVSMPALPAALPLPDPAPPVTALIPTRDRPDLLEACVRGLLERTNYPALRLLLLDNGSTDPAALALLAEYEKRPGVRVLRRPGPFNFAALNNDAAREAGDGALLLLNSDVEVIQPDWLRAMAALLVRPGVGIVGARLLYPDRTVQHAGILLGPAGAATHVGRGAAETDEGYLGQLQGVRDFSAVTGACLLVAAETWRAVGGMDERLAVTWNDVDLCLRVRRAGLRVVWTAAATLLHREAQTRGLEAADPAALARFREEQRLVMREWGEALERDPFLNANLLALESGALALTRPRGTSPPLATP